jgi:hypothetical protein
MLKFMTLHVFVRKSESLSCLWQLGLFVVDRPRDEAHPLRPPRGSKPRAKSLLRGDGGGLWMDPRFWISAIWPKTSPYAPAGIILSGTDHGGSNPGSQGRRFPAGIRGVACSLSRRQDVPWRPPANAYFQLQLKAREPGA